MDYQAVPAEEPGDTIMARPVHTITRKPVPSSTAQERLAERDAISSPTSTVRIATTRYSETRTTSSSTGGIFTGQWTPLTLRWLFLACLVGIILLFIAVLIAITLASHANQGFSDDSTSINNLAIYVPTVVVILFGFTWQRLVSDVKKVAPWNILAKGWSPARETLFTGYLNDLEIFSLWRAARRGHWAIFLALLGGFLSGLLVVFTNTLFFVEPQHTISDSSSSIHTTSSIQLDKLWDTATIDPLVLFQPVIARRMYQGAAVPWTTDEFVFDSFGIESTPLASDHQTLVSQALGYGPQLSCEHIHYRVTNTTDWLLQSEAGRYGYGVFFMNLELKPENEDDPCPFTHHVWYRLAESRTTFGQESYSVSWLNTTNCDGDDNRLLVTTVRYLYTRNATEKARRQFLGDGLGSPDVGTFHAAGLRCKPALISKSMFLSVNVSSDINTPYVLSRIEPSKPNAVSPSQSLGALLPPMLPFMNPAAVKALFLRNGTEFLRAEIFTKFHLEIPILDDNGSMVGSSYLSGPPWDTFIDPWFYILTEGNLTKLDSYREDLDQLEADSRTLFATIWIHLLDLFARQDQTVPLGGEVTTQGPRLMVSEASAWSLMTIFVILLGLIACLATVSKPVTHLSEDPGNLAAIAVILARNPQLRGLFKGRGSLREPNLRFLLASYKVRTQRSADHLPMILVDSIRIKELNLEMPIVPTSKKWRPASLHPFSRVLVMTIMTGCIVTLWALFKHIPHGLSWGWESNQWWMERIPIAIIVLLGYTVAGIDSAIQSLQPYRALQKGRAMAQQSLLFKAGNHSVFTVPYLALARARDVALFASALSVLIYPAVKIAAAGLFIPVNQQNQHPMNAEVDNSFSAMLNLSEPVDYVAAALYTNAYTLTALEQLYNVSNQPNFIGSGNSSSLVIGNFTKSLVNDDIYRLLSSNDDIIATLPAMNVVISCNSTSGLEETEFKDGTLETASCYRNTYSIAYASGGETFLFGGGDYTRYAQTSMSINQSATATPRNADLNSIAIAKCDGENATALSGVWCQRTFQEVNVNATLRQRTVNNLGQKATTSLEIDYIDMSSMVVINSSLSGGDWIYPVLTPEAVVRTDGGYGVNESIQFDNMTAYSGIGWNMTAAMSTYSSTLVNILLTGLASRGQDIEVLFDHAVLQAYMEKLYLAFHIHAIDQMRTLYPVVSHPVLKPVLVLIEEVRLKQSLASTITVSFLLGLILLFTLLAFIIVQGKGIVNMQPTTLAAQFALLSDSFLVDELANDGVVSTSDTRVWHDNRFAMGWISQGSQSAADSGRISRLWGVDFDEKIRRRE